MDKTMIRKEVRRRLAEIDRQTMHDKSTQICLAIANSEEFEAAETICGYFAMEEEANLDMLLHLSIGLHKTTAVPYVVDGEMHFSVIHSIQDTRRGAYGIREPKVIEEIHPDDPLILVPGVAFDEMGHRVGHGAGYYDRYLTKCKGTYLGIAFSEQMFKEVPFEAHDILMHRIISA